MKYLYILVSNNSDTYLEQTYISMYSLHLHMPNAKILLLVDERTDSTFANGRENLLKYVDEKIVIELDNGMNNMKRSRYLKTTARQYFSGDYLYIDSDTIITAPLDEIEKLDCSIGAVRDTHVSIKKHILKKTIIRLSKEMDYSIEGGDNFFNSGVLFVKDSAESFSFYKKWHENWVLGTTKNIFIDQISLAKTDAELGHTIQEINGVWNCQVTYGVRYLTDAKIVHYLCTNIMADCADYAYYFQDRRIFFSLKEHNYLIDNELHSNIENAKKCFGERLKIVSGEDIDLMSSYLFIMIMHLYYKHKRIFHNLESVMIKCIKIVRWFDKIIVR